MEEKFKPKKLGLKESDFENRGKSVDTNGYTYDSFIIKKQKLVPSEESVDEKTMSHKDWDNIAKITCGDSTPRQISDYFLFKLDESDSLSELIDVIEHNYANHQFIKKFGGVQTYESILKVYSEYKELFEEGQEIKVLRSYNNDKELAVAKELGLSVVAYGSLWCNKRLYKKSKLRVGDIYNRYLLPDDYGGYPVHINVDRNDMCEIKPNTFSRIPNMVCGFVEDSDRDEYSMEMFNKFQSPQRWKIGKLTDKKRIAWMEYIENYFRGLEKFITERKSAVNESRERLVKAGFVKIDERNFYKEADKCFRCEAKIGDDGKIYTTVEITDSTKLKEKFFNY